MKIGLSTYSLHNAVKSGLIDTPSIIDWVADNGGEHVELSLGSCCDVHADGVAQAIKQRARKRGIMLSSYTLGANFITETAEQRRAEIERIKKEIEMAAFFEVPIMRFDPGRRVQRDATIENFEKDLPPVTDACGELADYAAKYGIIATAENHGFHFQNSDRIKRLVMAVNRPNYRTTMDVGNFLCADEEPVAAVKNNIGIAVQIHFKDFLRRSPSAFGPDDKWIQTRAGFRLRGTIIGHGDINLPEVAKIIAESNFDGCITVEFEGPEDCFTGSLTGMNNVKKLFGL